MTVIKLRDYQTQIIAEIEDAFLRGHKAVLGVAPTGAGKTVIFAQIIKDAIAQSLTCMVVVHRPSTLIGQTVDKLKALGITPSLICAGSAVEPSQSVYIASLQTLANRDIPPVDLVIFDEAHTTSFYASSDRIFQSLPAATPWRLKKTQSLSDRFDGVVRSPGYQHMIVNGYLVAPRYFAYRGTDRIDLSGVATKRGEYTVKGLDVVCNTPRMVQRTVEEFKRICGDRPSICFAVSVAHAKSLFEVFSSYGVSAEVVTSKTSLKERLKIFGRFDDGEIQMLISVEVLTEGYDSPKASCVIMARPTLSKGLYVQMVGRGLRPLVNKKDCIVLDIADNALTHGLITQIDFDDIDASGTSNPGLASVKQCPDCGIVVANGFAECPECGYVFRKDKDEEFDIQQPLEEVDPASFGVLDWRMSLAWEKKAFSALLNLTARHLTYKWVYVSLSYGVTENDFLKERLAEMNSAFQRLTQRKSWPGVGWLKVLEISPLKDGRSHLYIHCLLMVKASYMSRKYLSQDDWSEHWASSLRVGDKRFPVISKNVPIAILEETLTSMFRQGNERLPIELSQQDLAKWVEEVRHHAQKTRRIAGGGLLQDELRKVDNLGSRHYTPAKQAAGY